MVKFTIFLGLAITIVFSIIASSGNQAVEANSPAAAPRAQVALDLLPAGTLIPDELPTTITDPILLAGWVYLFHQQEPLSLWDEKPLTGREIAKAVIDLNVNIQWNTNNECNGSSCTERPVCRLDSTCKPAGENLGHVDIVIAARYQDRNSFNISKLAGTIAHEMVHYLMPFGGPDDTLYEEFWAFAVGSQISKNTTLDFEGYNPLKESCLKLWYHANQRDFYRFLPSYPPSIQPSADTQQPNCSLIRHLPGETDGF
jgi:hypothetical protein